MPTTRWGTTRAGSGCGGGGWPVRDEQLDNNHLMRMAGRFARRVRAFGKAHGVPVIDCAGGERKHRIAEDFLAEHQVQPGVFLILVARAPATVWEVTHTPGGAISNLAKKHGVREPLLVPHHGIPNGGTSRSRCPGTRPSPRRSSSTATSSSPARPGRRDRVLEGGQLFYRGRRTPNGLARIADTLSQPGTAGRLGQVCDRWIYTACLCFGLDTRRADPQRVPLRLLRLPGRVQPEPVVRRRREDGQGCSTPWSTAPVPGWT